MDNRQTSMPEPDWIIHICDQTAWEEAERRGEYRAASLEQEGFIHASRPEQVLWVANQFYQNGPPLVLLWIRPKRLQAPLRYDAVGEQSFPHIYGPVNLDAVERVTAFLPDTDGIFRRVDS
jgi:uncharacterized protein (DUF952 family)